MNFNNEERLFKNKFITGVDNSDIPDSKKEEFRRFHERKKEQTKQQTILDRSTKNKTSENVYEDLAVFSTSKQIKINEKLNSVKVEKKTIVSIDSKDRDVNKYPEQNNFISFLGKTFFNLKKIELVSTEIPNTDQVIKDLPVELKNNRISWQNEEDSDLNFFENVVIITTIPDTVYIVIENHGISEPKEVVIYNSKLDIESSVSGIIDGKRLVYVVDSNTLGFEYMNGLSGPGTTSIDLGYPIYHVDIKPGNYTAATLADQISKDTGLIKRRNGSGQFHFFEVMVNFDTDVLFLDSVVTTQLPSNSISTISGSTTITVNQKGHGFKSGDRVKMIGVKTFAGIPGNILNGDFFVNVLDFNTFTYEVITRASETADGGGNTIKTGKDAPFRLLFHSEQTRIQFNTGFPDEDSSESIKSDNPITTKALKISNVQIISSEYIRITTVIPHGLSSVTVLEISNISTGADPVITTSVPHLIELPRRITIRGANCIPEIKGTFFAIPNGISTFRLKGLFVETPGNTGEAIYGKDKIKINRLRTVPSILIDPVYFVENITSPNNFDIKFSVASIDEKSITETVIGTSQLFVNHPNHGFNQITGITSSSPGFANIKLLLNNESLYGTRTIDVSIIDGPLMTNTIDVLLSNHSLETSDTITILNSDTDPDVNGTYKVQVVDQDTLRINFVHSSFVPGTGTVLTGDYVTISHTNSLPKIDGRYHIDNRRIISNISTGIIVSEITTFYQNNFEVGDTVMIIGSNCVPSIDGEHYIQNIINSNTFTISLTDEIENSGDAGSVINKSRFFINTGFDINISGVNPAGILGRNNKIILYRAQPDIPNGSSINTIPLTSINDGNPREIEKFIDTNNYVIRALEEYAEDSITAGGSSVTVSSERHGLRSIQANTFDGTINSKLFRSISLEGENYLYLVIEGNGIDFQTVLNTANVPNTFAKIILSESPGNMIFNSFVSEAKVFDKPIAKLDTLRFSVLNSKGFLFDFNDINYSFTIRMTEITEEVQDSGINSRSGSTNFDSVSGNENKKTGGSSFESGFKTGSQDSSFNKAGQIRSSAGRF